MRKFCVVLLGLLLLPGAAALAHRVNVFAYVENGEVVVECSYSKSKRVNRGQIEVRALPGDEVLLCGETDEQGNFRFPLPPKALELGADLRILLQAGEGHQNEWTVAAGEFMPAGTPAALGAIPAAPQIGENTVALSPAASLSRSELEAVVNAALDAKLGPIKRMLLEQTEAGPGLTEIVGGIGWIFGLVGVAAYFKGRSRV